MRLLSPAIVWLALCGVVAAAPASPPAAPDLGAKLDQMLVEAKRLELRALAAHQEPAPVPIEARSTGLKVPADLKQRVAASFARHGANLAFAVTRSVGVSSYDCRHLIGPIKNQGNCGSCYSFAGVGACEAAFIKAGVLKQADQLSEQQFGDCVRGRDFCDGGWPEEVCQWSKKGGLALTSEYGPYRASPGQCKQVSKTFKIDDFGYVGQDDSVPPYESFKAAMIQYGPLSICVAADNAFSNIRPGQVFLGSSSGQVNHAIMAVGFDDTKANGSPAILVRNSWGTSWADGGYAWVKYGANRCGYGAMWASVKAVDPPPPPPPDPTPTPGKGFTGTITRVQKFKDGKLTDESTYLGEIKPGDESLKADLAGAGVSPELIAALLKLVADLRSKSPPRVIIADIAAILALVNKVSDPVEMPFGVVPDAMPSKP